MFAMPERMLGKRRLRPRLAPAGKNDWRDHNDTYEFASVFTAWELLIAIMIWISGNVKAA